METKIREGHHENHCWGGKIPNLRNIFTEWAARDRLDWKRGELGTAQGNRPPPEKRPAGKKGRGSSV